jgi:hypothetical protein
MKVIAEFISANKMTSTRRDILLEKEQALQVIG